MNSKTLDLLVPLGLMFLTFLAGCGQTGSDPLRITSPDSEQPTDTQLSEVASVSIIPDHAVLGVGLIRQLRAVAYDSAGAALYDRSIHWSSSDASIATVDETGLVRGVGLGSVTVTALCEGKRAAATIVVRQLGTVLVDASRDGGVWWFPQAGPFDPELYHQGKALADYLKSLGLQVRELPRPTRISIDLLEGYDLVIRAVACGGYSESEVLAYRQYVEAGGNLLLLDDHKRHAPPDAVGRSFGVLFAGVTRGSQGLKFVADPITEGLASGQLYYRTGSALIEYPPEAKILAYLDESSYLDLNANESKDDGEPVAPPVMGKLTAGAGQIVFTGDTNYIEHVPQPLIDNLIRALLPGVVTPLKPYTVGGVQGSYPLCVAGCS